MRRLILHLLVALFTFACGTAPSALLRCLLAPPAEEATIPTVVTPTELAKPINIVTDPLPCGCVQSYPVGRGVDTIIQPAPVRQPISGGILNGRAISLPKPSYPAAACAKGTVVVQVIIDECGCVISAHAISGHPLRQVAAVQAAHQARFVPVSLRGQRVRVQGVIIYNFEPSNSSQNPRAPFGR